jgi:hypothetical protein
LQLLAGTARISRFNILVRFLVRARCFYASFWFVYLLPIGLSCFHQDDSVLKTVAATLAQVKCACCSEQEWLSLRDKYFPQ